MKGQIKNDLGKVVVNSDVIATYAGSVAVECFGIVGMASVNLAEGIAKLLKQDTLKSGILVDIDTDNRISIDFHCIVSYGVSIPTVTENLVDTVKYKVAAFAGMEVKCVNVFVEGIKVID